jgi:hypothetical protein
VHKARLASEVGQENLSRADALSSMRENDSGQPVLAGVGGHCPMMTHLKCLGACTPHQTKELQALSSAKG